MIRVTLDGLVKRHDRIAVVELDPAGPLVAGAGELTVVLGPANAGKTTIARLVAGLEAPDAGEVYFDGRPMSKLRPHERKVGFAAQADSLWPHLSVAEHLAYGLRARRIGRKERRNRIEEALSSCRLDGLDDRKPSGLTPAQRRRVVLARAFVVEPDLLLLDEPLDGLTGRPRDELRDDLRRIHAETRATTLILTRDPHDALALADRVVVLDLGRVVQVGSPDEVYNRPADVAAAQLLGATNVLQGQSEGTDARGETIVRTPLGRLVGRATAGPLAAGAPATVAIRPASIGLGPSVPSGSNRFAATVERQVLLGELRHVHLRGPGDWPVVALALQSQSAGLKPGQALTVSVPPAQVFVLPSQSTPAP